MKGKKVIKKVIKRMAIIVFAVIALFVAQASNVFATDDPLITRDTVAREYECH